MGKKFDICIQNPPYDNGLHEKFLLKMLQISDKVISVQPLSWLLGKRQNKKITSIIDKSTAEIEQINGNTYFDAAIGGTMGIISVDLTSVSSDIVFDGKAYSKCEEITTYSNDELLVEFKNIVEPLYKADNLDKHLKYIPNLPGHVYKRAEHEEHNPNDNWWVMKVSSIIGGNDSFYSFLYKGDVENCVGIFKNLSKKIIKYAGQDKLYLNYYFAFNTKQEAYNLLNYLMCDFARLCLYFIKYNMHIIANGAYAYIPWFDFSDPVFSKSPSEIDDYLFKKYNISDKIRNHIEEILPDYYGIRKG